MIDTPWRTVEEAAVDLGLSTNRLRKLMEKGRIQPDGKSGRRWLFHRDSLSKWTAGEPKTLEGSLEEGCDLCEKACYLPAEGKPGLRELTRLVEGSVSPWFMLMAGESVYFVQSGTGGPIKIGFTRKVGERIWGMQTGNPEELKLLLVLALYEDADMDMERRLHKRFAKDRIRNEWFKPSFRLLSFIHRKQLEVQGHEGHRRLRLRQESGLVRIVS